MIELNDFYNDGSGWVCRHCDRELSASNAQAGSRPRLLTEGEADVSHLAGRALAKWADAARRTLLCPRCGITEFADLA